MLYQTAYSNKTHVNVLIMYNEWLESNKHWSNPGHISSPTFFQACFFACLYYLLQGKVGNLSWSGIYQWAVDQVSHCTLWLPEGRTQNLFSDLSLKKVIQHAKYQWNLLVYTSKNNHQIMTYGNFSNVNLWPSIVNWNFHKATMV